MKHGLLRFACGFTCVALLVCGCGGNEGGTGKPLEPIDVNVIKLQPEDVALSVDFVGQTKGAVDADVRARVEGVILAIHFKEGQPVKEGDLLYEIDPAPFQAKLAEARARQVEAETRLVKAESDLKRIRPLAEMKAVSERDLDAAVAAVGVAQGAVEAARAGVTSAEIELGYTRILAPVSGLIGLTKARVGEFVGRAPNAVVLNTVSDLQSINVRFTVNEKDYLYFARLQQKSRDAGQIPVQRELELVLADNSVHPQKGQLVSVDSQIDPATGSLSAEAAFPNPGEIIRPGQFARVRTTKETIEGALILPKNAVRELQGIMQVMLVGADNITALRSVKLGSEIAGRVIVKEGLNAGDLVVAETQARLKSGVKINPRIVNADVKDAAAQ